MHLNASPSKGPLRAPLPRLDERVHERFAALARQNPKAPALTFGGETLTYGELNARADALAAQLRKLGVTAETRVAICVERSFELVVGVLGILKAAGVYVPIDPEFPQPRMSYILTDSAAKVVLTFERFAETFRELGVAAEKIVCLDRPAPAPNVEQRQSFQLTPDALCYIMYTSGSTGEPKGVGVTHRGVVRLACETDYQQFGLGDVGLMYAPLAFDASTYEMWTMLLNGGALAIVRPGRVSPAELGGILCSERVNNLCLTTGLFHQLVDHRLEDLAGVRHVLCGGDVMSPSHVQRALDGLSATRLYNGYGPTENAVMTTCHAMSPGEQLTGDVPIGKPIARTSIYLLDERLELVANGETGELFAAGDGLARGYINRPDLTAAMFLPNPFSGIPGDRMYRTGDLARWGDDGVLHFAGRADHQVKVRGFRIEPGEIEAALRLHPAIRQAVVIVREDSPGDKRLVAYFVATQPLGASELRSRLEAKLPAQLIPSAFLQVDELPINANGKLDRARLPVPAVRPELNQSFVPPETPLERSLAAIWAELLGVDQVGIHDHFLELGGDSFLSAEIAQRAAEEGIAIDAQHLFEHPTIAELVLVLETARA